VIPTFESPAGDRVYQLPRYVLVTDEVGPLILITERSGVATLSVTLEGKHHRQEPLVSEWRFDRHCRETLGATESFAYIASQ
jgi:hypothetical protein